MKSRKRICLLCMIPFLVLQEVNCVPEVLAEEMNQMEDRKEELNKEELEKEDNNTEEVVADSEEEEKKEERIIQTTMEELHLHYGESIVLEELIEGDIPIENLTIKEENPQNEKDILEIGENQIRAIGINGEERGETMIAIMAEETDDYYASNVVSIPVFVDKVPVETHVCVESDKIPLYGKLHVETQLYSEIPDCQDLLEQDQKIEVGFYLENEEDEIKELEKIKSVTQMEFEKWIVPFLFRPFKKESEFRLKIEICYQDEYCPYVFTEKEYPITIGACSAYLHTQVSEDGIYDYRKDLYEPKNLHLELKRNTTFTQQELSEEEKEELQYEIEISDTNVISTKDDEKIFSGTVDNIPLEIHGVGKASIIIKVSGGEIYEIEEKVIDVEVRNSALYKEDIQMIYKTPDGKEIDYCNRYDDWITFLDKQQGWINGSVLFQLSESGRKYYDTIGYEIKHEKTETKETITFDKEAEKQVLSYWMKNETANVNTEVAEKGKKELTFGIDQTKPAVSSFTYSKDCFSQTKTDQKAYYNHDVVIEGSFSDQKSGIKEIEYTPDGRNLENIQWKTLPKTWKDGDKEVKFSQVLGQGKYPAVAFRAIDVAGNVSEIVKVSENGKEYQELIIDQTEPVLNINTAVDGKMYHEEWTKKPITIAVEEKREEAFISGIHKVLYQYVKIGETYQEKQWSELQEDKRILLGFDEVENKNGTYYFKAISNSGVETSFQTQKNTSVRVKLQQTLPEKQPIEETRANKERKNEWYNKESKVPHLSFSYPVYEYGVKTKEYGAPITVHTSLSSVDEAGKREVIVTDATMGIRNEEEYKTFISGNEKGCTRDDISKLDIDFNYDEETGYAKDGIYELSYWISDEAGNKSEIEKKEYKIDTHEPNSLTISIGEEELLAKKEPVIIYDHFYQEQVTGKVSAEYGISGRKSFKVHQARKINDWKQGLHNINKANDSFQITPNTRCFFYGLAEDVAGNQAEIWTRGIVVENAEPNGQNGPEIIVKPTEYNKNHFFNQNVTVEISVNDQPDDENFSGLEEVNCTVGITNGNDQVTSKKTLFSSYQKNITTEEIDNTKKFNIAEIISAKENESNYAFIEVTARDRAGNIKTSKERMQIDITKPEIQVDFVDGQSPQNEKFYSKNRVAKIQIQELNFDPKQVKIEAKKDGEDYVIEIPSWETNGDMHTADITFTEDGAYTFSVKAIDLADNESEIVQVEEFVVDQTKPTLEITYDQTSEHLPGYFPRNRIATIKIHEHNFYPEGVTLVAEPKLSMDAWKQVGDDHFTTISIDEDGDYEFHITGTDLAGNEMNLMESEVFTIDTKMPEIEITGVENGSANKGEIDPYVIIADENLYEDGIHIQVSTGKGNIIKVDAVKMEQEKRYQYHLKNLSAQVDDIYYLTVFAQDKAGNVQEMTYRYSLNRFGSTYDLTQIGEVGKQKYNQYQKIDDLVITEMNVDKIEEYAIFVSRNGKLLETVENDHVTSPEIISFSTKKTGNEKLGYTNTYIIHKENFAEEGLYNITLYSKDQAGNEINSTLENKEAKIQFIIDNTMPTVMINGIESGKVYDTDKKIVNVLVSDNFKIKDAIFYLIDDKGEIIKTWDYTQNAEEGKSLMLEIPESKTPMSIVYTINDMAGNTLEVLKGGENYPGEFVVSTNPWIRFIHSARRIAFDFCLISILISYIIYRRKKKTTKQV